MPASVGVTAEKDAAGELLTHGCNCGSESLLVALCTAAWWWPVWSQLAERQIEAEDRESEGAEGFGQCEEEQGVGACSGAVREDEAVVVRGCRTETGWAEEMTSDWYFIRSSGR